MHVTTQLKKVTLSLALCATVIGGTLSPASAFLDKTRFAAHLGIAYFCFHHWVLNPYQQGAFASGAPHRTAAVIKGGAALLFAVHEVRVADKIARESNDPLLRKLDGGIQTMMASFGTIGSKLKSGHFDPNDVATLKDLTGSVRDQAAAGGTKIHDVPVAVPGS